ncbi:MAG TPA: hypothetical protein VGD81_11720 [Opitutaceae bacterium]
MRKLPILLSGVVAFACPDAESRTFTDIQGRTLNAELLDATLTHAKIRRDDGQVFELKLETLCDADRAYIVAWTRQRAAQAPVALRFATSQFKQTAKRDQDAATLSRTEDAGYTVTIHNESSTALENVRIEYRVFMLDDRHGAKRSQMALKSQSGSERIAQLAAKTAVDFKTVTLPLQRLELKPDWVYVDGAKRKIADQLAGIWFKVYRADGTQIGEYASTESLKKEKW